MAPSSIAPVETTSELTHSRIKHTITETASSISINGDCIQFISELDASKLAFTRNLSPHAVPEPNSPAVWSQSVSMARMMTCQWSSTRGWASPHLEPFDPLQLMPTASVLHYATECFEGLNCYRGQDLKLRLFRPDCNTWRILKSSIRINVPTFDPHELQQLIENLVAVEGEKVTKEPTRDLSVLETNHDRDSGSVSGVETQGGALVHHGMLLSKF